MTNYTEELDRLQKLKILYESKQKQVSNLKEQRKKLNAEEEKYRVKLEKNEIENKIFYLGIEGKEYIGPNNKWKLNAIQKILIEAVKDPANMVFTYTGANRIGKTFITMIIIYSFLTGKFPWEPEEMTGHLWELFGWKPPIKIRWVGQDWEKHVKTVLIPIINELWPKSHPIQSRNNNVGVPAIWTEGKYNGTLEIMSNASDSSLFEGWHGHLIAYDEPPKRNVRVACARGLIDTNGKELFAMTLLKEPWVHQEVINRVLEDGRLDPSVFNISGDINVNIGHGITKKGVDQFALTLNDEEKTARLKGIPSYLSGKILSIDRTKHIKERFEIPSHWEVDVAIDIGVAKPHDIMYLAISPRNFKYVFFERQVTGDGVALGNQIISDIEKYNMRVANIICDPLAKSNKNEENTTWQKIEIVLNKYGYFLQAGAKDKESGILLIQSSLSSKYGEPSLYIFRDCVRAILQLDGWMYDDQGIPKKYKINEKPGDDQCENLYRLLLLETQYTDPIEDEGREDPYYEQTERNPYTGY